MESITINEIVEAVNGEINEYVSDNCRIHTVSTDSRNIEEGSLFVPLVGENFDGHDYINAAFENGAKLTLSSRRDLPYPAIYVEDTKVALMNLAEFYRKKINPIIIGITGSVGKTTTKEIISSVLSKKYKVLKTYKNFNNEIGVPLTIFELDKSHEILVLELGMNTFGEMHNLSKMSRPDYVVLTNIGSSHVGNFNGKEDILKAKSEIFDYFEGNKVIINGDDDYLLGLKDKYSYGFYEYGLRDSNPYKVIKHQSKGIFGNSIAVKTPKDLYEIDTKAIGDHLAYNVLPAIIMGEIFGLEKEEIINGIENYRSADMRMELITLDKIKVINDAYNASLESMKSAIKTLINSYTSGRRVAFLGDILELGDKAEEHHRALGEYVAKCNVDVLIAVGEDAKYIYEEAKKYNMKKCYYFKNRSELKNELSNIVLDDDLILLKGSRGSKMEEFINYLQ